MKNSTRKLQQVAGLGLAMVAMVMMFSVGQASAASRSAQTAGRLDHGQQWVFGSLDPGLRWVFGGLDPGLRWVFGGLDPGLRWVFGGLDPGLRWVFKGRAANSGN